MSVQDADLTSQPELQWTSALQSQIEGSPPISFSDLGDRLNSVHVGGSRSLSSSIGKAAPAHTLAPEAEAHGVAAQPKQDTPATTARSVATPAILDAVPQSIRPYTVRVAASAARVCYLCAMNVSVNALTSVWPDRSKRLALPEMPFPMSLWRSASPSLLARSARLAQSLLPLVTPLLSSVVCPYYKMCVHAVAACNGWWWA